MQQRSLPSIITAAVLVIILGLYMVTYQVRFNQVAVVRTFGKVAEPDPDTGLSDDVKTQPGLYWKWPWPIQAVVHYDNRLQVTETTGEELSTNDKKNVIVTTVLKWRIGDPYQFSNRNQDMKSAEEKLTTLLRDRQKTVISEYNMENFVSVKENERRYDEIEERILGAVQSKQDTYGITLEYVGIEKLALPKRITGDVFSAMKEERNAEAAKYTSQGESDADGIRAEAEGIAGTILAFAREQAGEIVAEGKRRAADYNKEFGKNEELAIFLLQMDYLGTILKDRTTLILDAAQSPLDILREPLRAAGMGTKAPDAKTDPTAAAGVSVPEVTQPE